MANLMTLPQDLGPTTGIAVVVVLLIGLDLIAKWQHRRLEAARKAQEALERQAAQNKAAENQFRETLAAQAQVPALLRQLQLDIQRLLKLMVGRNDRRRQDQARKTP